MNYQLILCSTLLLVFGLAAIGPTDAATATTRIPNSWNVKECVNSAKVRTTRDNCKNYTNHNDIEECIMKGLKVYDGTSVNLEDSKKLIDGYDAPSTIKAGLKRDVGRCTVPAKQRNCCYTVLTKRCLMDPSLKKPAANSG